MSVWSSFSDRPKIESILQGCLKEECLKTFIAANARLYNALSTPQLAALFDTPPDAIEASLRRLVADGTLAATVDSSAGVIEVHKVEVLLTL
jgi:hypothetical protein